jgi:thiamine transporter ThiT
MKTFIPARLRVPLAYALGGAIFAAAWAVRGGAAWWLSIVVAVSVAARTPARAAS